MYCIYQHTSASNITCYYLYEIAIFALQSQETQTLDHVKEAPSNDSQSSRSTAGYYCLANLEIVNIQQTSLGLRRFFLHNLPTRIAVWGPAERIMKGYEGAVYWWYSDLGDFEDLWGNYMDFKYLQIRNWIIPFPLMTQSHNCLLVMANIIPGLCLFVCARCARDTSCSNWSSCNSLCHWLPALKGFSTHPDWGRAGLSNVQTKNMEEHAKAYKSMQKS